jgi:hypothetical protein
LIHLDNVCLRELIEPAGLIESIRNGCNGNLDSSPRLHQTIPGAHSSTLLIMPAWQRGGDIGIKMVTVDAWRSRQGGEAVNRRLCLAGWRFRRYVRVARCPCAYGGGFGACVSSAGAEGCFDATDDRHRKPRSVPGADASVGSELQPYSGVGTRLRKGAALAAVASLERHARLQTTWQLLSRVSTRCAARPRTLLPWCMAGSCSRNARGPYRQFHTGDARGG